MYLITDTPLYLVLSTENNGNRTSNNYIVPIKTLKLIVTSSFFQIFIVSICFVFITPLFSWWLSMQFIFFHLYTLLLINFMPKNPTSYFRLQD